MKIPDRIVEKVKGQKEKMVYEKLPMKNYKKYQVFSKFVNNDLNSSLFKRIWAYKSLVILNFQYLKIQLR